MKKYDSYKDSGVEWIGEIPSHWTCTKVKYNLLHKGYKAGPFGSSLITSELLLKGSIKVFSPEHVADKVIQEEWYLPEERIEEMNQFLVNDRDVVLPIVGTLGLARVFYRGKDGSGIINQRLAKVSCDSRFLIPEFFCEIMQNVSNYQEYFRIQARGSILSHLNKETIVSMPLMVPPIDEQEKILSYLNLKINQLNKLIAKKERLIQLLEEERTAVINQAVTKGIDPTVPMKDSGIEWLGEIPENWELKRLRYIGNCQNGISAGAEYFGSGFPFVSYSDVYKNEILPISVDSLAQSSEKEQSHYSIEKGDILFTRTSETIEEIGMSSICCQTIEQAVFAGFLIRFRPYKEVLDLSFSRYFFRSKIPRTFFVKEMNLVTRASLSQELLKRLPVMLPPMEEQKAIGEYLDHMTKEIDGIISKTHKEIDLIKEYKTVLISEVVTGKVDVRNEK